MHLSTIPRIIVSPPNETEMSILEEGRLELTEETKNELTQWAIHELIEQNNTQESNNCTNKKIMALMGTVTAVASLTLVVGQLVELWS